MNFVILTLLVRADEVTTDKRARDIVNEVCHVMKGRSELKPLVEQAVGISLIGRASHRRGQRCLSVDIEMRMGDRERGELRVSQRDQVVTSEIL